MTESEALYAYVNGTISFAALRNAISGSTDFVFHPGAGIQITTRRRLPTVTIRPQHIRRALTRYTNGELTLEELSTWGMVLHGLDAFDVDAGSGVNEEDLWDVIGQLSVASVNKAFDDQRVAELLTRATPHENATAEQRRPIVPGDRAGDSAVDV